MKLKHIFFSIMFIMLLVGITCVSAENIDNMGDLSTNDVDDVISADDLYDNDDLSANDVDDSLDDGSSLDEKDVLPSRGSTTVDNWTALGTEVYYNNYDTIYLGDNITPGGQIVINHNVTIIGSANTYIGGSSSSNPVSYSNIPIYSNANGLSITLKDIRFQNCGGNILMKFSGNGHYVLDNCTFENVTATGDHQSVVHLNLGNCDIINCTFEKCTTSYGTVSNYNENSVTNVHMTVRDSTFKNNHATVEPGCINNCGQLEVYDSTFEGNSATWWAGAIHTHTNANTTVVRSIFRNNIAGWNGGALYTYSHLTVIDSIFIGNEAHQTSGGAIAGSGYGSRPYLTVLNCEFKNNTASGSGGAISFGSSELIVNNSVFDNNKALSGTGGAISTSGATSNITYSNFTNNSATGRGGAIYATGNGQLNVYYCNFVNDTGSEGQDMAYYYTTKKTNKAFFNYDYDEFWGLNNASGSIYAYNTQYLSFNPGTHNVFHDINEHVDPSGDNDTNTSDIIVPDSFNGIQLWNASLSGALGGTPLVNGDRIYVPNGHSIYCLNITNGNLLWNVSSTYVGTSEWNNFHDFGLHNGVLIAPCDGDKLYFFNATDGSEIQSTSNIIQGSSLYAPLVVGDTIYISSECGYGVNNESWITVIKYNNGVYSYAGSILNISGISYGNPALISAPILWNNYLWVNTVNGLMRVDLATNTSNIVLANTVGKPVVGGNNIFVLTNTNRVCAIGANGNIAMNILVNGSVGVGSTLVSNALGNMVFTVCEDGSVYMILYYAQEVIPVYKVNQVSSALSIGTNNILYVGDDEGILWAFRVIRMGSSWMTQTLWAFNASSTIHGTPVISGNKVYIGTEDMFYAVSGSSNANILLNINNELSYSYEGKSSENDLLGLSNDEILGEYNEVHVTHENFNQEIFRQSNTIFYIDEGVYEVKDFYIGGYSDFDYDYWMDVIYSYENIVIKPNEDAKVTIKILKSEYDGSSFSVLYGKNITIENIKFTSEKHHTVDGVVKIGNAENVMFNNCTFENITNDESRFYPSIIQIMDGTLYSWDADNYKTKNPVINNCKFIDCKAMYIVVDTHNQMPSGEDLGLVNISNCIFENSVGTFDGSSLSLLYDAEVYLENNTFDSVSPITITAGEIISEVSFKFLTKTLTNNTPSDIEAELVDSKGNHIYASNLKFSVNGGEEQKPTYKNGIYTLSYTPHENKVNVIASCSNVNCLFEEEEFSVVVSPELTINSTDAITYGDSVIEVNATLKEDINGENVTFTISKGDTIIDSLNATVNNGFANVTFNLNQKLIVGTYTIAVSYAGNDNYGNAEASKTLTVKKATPNINVTVDPVIGIGDPIVITITLPEDLTGEFEVIGIAHKNSNMPVTPKYNVKINSTVLTIVFNETAPLNDYWVWYTYNGDVNYNKAEITFFEHDGAAEFKIVKHNPTLNITHSAPVIYENVTITITMNDDINENVTVNINGVPKNKTLINGKLEFNITDVPYGPQNITVSFAGNERYNATEKNISFFVDYLDANLSISAEPVNYGESLVVMVTANENLSGEVIVKIGNLTKNVDIVDGKGNVSFANLTAGDHFITALFECDHTFAGDSANATATVKGVEVPADKALNTNVPADSKSPTFSIKLDKDATGNFTVIIDDGKTFNKTVELKDGSASITADNLAVGSHNVSVSYSGDSKYAPITKNTTVTIKEPAKTTPGKDTKKVTKKATKIVAKKKTFKAKKKVKKYTITLKSGKTLVKKVKVTLKVKGKTYKATTNNKGKATFKIKNLKKKGKYTATIKFAGNKNYKPTTKKVKLTVKK